MTTAPPNGRAAAGARVVCDPANPGFGAGQNRGVAATSAPFVLLLNPDAQADGAGVESGVQWLRSDPRIGAVQGVITNRTTGLPERSQGRELGPVHLLGRALGLRRLLRFAPVRAVSHRIGLFADHVERVPVVPVPVESLAATALLVRREAFTAVGGFDESYFLYGEDLDLCHRMRADSWTLLRAAGTVGLAHERRVGVVEQRSASSRGGGARCGSRPCGGRARRGRSR